MADPRLVSYLRQHITSYPPDQLVGALRAQGWPEQEIQAALAAVTGAGPPRQEARNIPPPAAGRPPGLFGRLGGALAHPGSLFASVRGQGIGGALLTLIVAALLGTVLSLIGRMALLSGAGGFGAIIGLFSVIGDVFLLAVFVIGSFIAAGFLHLFVVLFRGSGGFRGTYKAVAYAWIPAALLFGVAGTVVTFLVQDAPVSQAVQYVFMAWSFILGVVGVSALHGVGKGKAFVIVLLPVAIILGVLFVLGMLAFTAIGDLSGSMQGLAQPL